MKDFQGKTAVITGAGSGFGLALARRCAGLGMQLVLVDVQAEALQAAHEELRAVCGAERGTERVLAEWVDVSRAEHMDDLAVRVQARFGAPHLVFNNAGVAFGGLVWEASARDWDWVLGVNLMGVVHGVRVFTPAMLAAARQDPGYQGHIVNTASMAGLLNSPNLGVYNVSKHAVVSLSETLHHDLGLVTDQVHASVLCPYFVPTGIAQSHRNRDPATLGRPTASQRVAHAMSLKAVSSGKLTADDIAERVLDAVRAQRFWILSHPQALAGVAQRSQELLQGENPGDPFVDRPDVGEALRAALRA